MPPLPVSLATVKVTCELITTEPTVGVYVITLDCASILAQNNYHDSLPSNHQKPITLPRLVHSKLAADIPMSCQSCTCDLVKIVPAFCRARFVIALVS
jgi:hypothetical protein